MPETLTGLIERVTYHNPENGFAVLKIQVKGRQDLVTVVGGTTSVSAGEHLEATGKWVVDREHGQQFKADELKTTHPASAEGIEKYLASGAIRSVGPKIAAKIVSLYKERTLEIFETAPDFLLHIKGIGHERVKRITQSWMEQKEVIVEDAVKAAVAEKVIVRESIEGESWLYLTALHRAEVGLAQSVHRIASATSHPMPKIEIEKAIAWVEGKLGIKLASGQQEAIRQACQQKLLIITGGPGVGKTTLVRSILEIFQAKKMKCVLAAPTGRAAKRLAESTGQTAKTIHRLLEFDPATGDFKPGRCCVRRTRSGCRTGRKEREQQRRNGLGELRIKKGAELNGTLYLRSSTRSSSDVVPSASERLRDCGR